MASLSIQEELDLPADPDTVFAYLSDPNRVVHCLPGAQLDEVTDDGSYAGSIKVKLGAVSIAYRGTARFHEVDSDSRRLRLEGKGREKGGQGSVKMTMDSRVEESAGGSRIVVNAEVQLAGRVVRFARGMLESVSKEVFRQFTECLASTIGGSAVTDPNPQGDPASGGDSGQATDREAAAGHEPPSSGPQELNALALLWSTFLSWLKGLGRR